ncbi:Ig-like domain-containing protein [Paramicrobacterium fandaimingii]|uniref:Ig-like domain-containing protein n=1 Tax=Paramicrobacterium fandaimingii TaxID=2708079 RepID=UPI0014226344|nr:Ig-like domain-containing protein [Microbacterium fandaimingii]
MPVRSRGRWHFFALAVVAAAALSLPLLFVSPAAASSAGSLVSTETDDGTETPSPPNTGDNATTPPPTSEQPKIDLVEPGDFWGTPKMPVTGTVSDIPENSVIQITSPRGDTSTKVGADGSFSTSVPVGQGADQEITATWSGSSGEVSAEATVDVFFTLSIDAPSKPIGKNGSLSGGNAADGATVTVRIDGHRYTTSADAKGRWAVSITDEFSKASATATQTMKGAGRASNPSAAVPVTVDLSAPSKPRITAPAAGATVPTSGATISGTGEPGSTVTVFVGAQSVCKVDVSSSGTWSCTAAEVATSGAQKIVAKADDTAGNSSGDGPAVTVLFGSSSSPSDPPATSPSDKPTDEKTTPGDSDKTPGEKEPEPSKSDDNDSRNEAAPPAAPPNGPGPWNHATPFTESLPPAIGLDAVAGWARALLLAVLTIALILIPARMLAGTLARRRVAASGVVFTGRNRSESEFERAPMLAVPGRIAMIVLGIAATGALTIFANPVDGRPAYLRLLLAAIVAAAIINAAAAWLPRILSHVWQCGFTEVRFNPRWLLVVAAAVLASRVFDLHPALLFALVTTVRVPTVLNSAVLARLALSRISGVFVVGVIAWLLASFVPQGGGFFTQLVIETANITALVGIGSAAIMMVPLGRLSGRAIFAWSRPLWLAAVLAILTALFVMLGPSIENWRATGNVLAALALVLAFAALGISVWLWKRYVQPMLASS